MATWKLAVIAYFVSGTLIIFLTKARQEVFGGLSRAEIKQIAARKTVAFYLIVTPVALLLWPVFLPGWFRKKDTLWDQLQRPPKEGGTSLKELYDVMNSLSEGGCDTDEIPGAEGEFAWDVSNPVPTHTTFGSTSYLTRLRTPSGEKISYERIGSFGSPASEMPVDGYELKDAAGNELSIIYLSPDQKRNSEKPPSGLVLEQ